MSLSNTWGGCLPIGNVLEDLHISNATRDLTGERTVPLAPSPFTESSDVRTISKQYPDRMPGKVAGDLLNHFGTKLGRCPLGTSKEEKRTVVVIPAFTKRLCLIFGFGQGHCEAWTRSRSKLSNDLHSLRPARKHGDENRIEDRIHRRARTSPQSPG